MKIEQVIQKAIDGGWKYQGDIKTDEKIRATNVKIYLNDSEDTKLYIDFNHLFLDPKFWQSLGKAMGWATEKNIEDYQSHRIGSHSDDFGGDSDYPCDCDKPRQWIDYWHQFVDHLVEGKNINEFFEKL